MSSARMFFRPERHHAGRHSRLASHGTGDMTAAPYLITPESEALAAAGLSIALIGPNHERRSEAALALRNFAAGGIRQFSAYSEAELDLARKLDEEFDAVLVDLDSEPEAALDLVERICGFGKSTVMVYSGHADPQALMRCMRAGAREFLTVPFDERLVIEALSRAAARRPAAAAKASRAGKMLVFLGAKGGVGVTSVACNFAVALAQNPGQKTLLIDLDLPLGDAALNLGIVSEFSTVNALEAADRLDGSFLNSLLAKHSSGVSVLSAPGRFPYFEPEPEAIEKLISVARLEFDNVVVDLGSRANPAGSVLFQDATAIYLVTQAGIPELRNSNRLISQVFIEESTRLEIVLNRFDSKLLGVSEEQITKALTRPAQWKIPSDHALLRKMQINAEPLALGDSAVAKTIRKMAEAVHGEQADKTPEKKKGFSLFG